MQGSLHGKRLHVISVISNPVRYKSRYHLYHKFREHMHGNKRVHLTTVEMAFGERPFEVTDPECPNHLQLRTWDEIWHKENMVNLGLAHALRQDPSAEYFAWIDADVEFQRKDWAEETLHALQHYQIVQPWQNAIDMGPNGEALTTHTSFCAAYQSGATYKPGYGVYWHTGYAWAATRDALDAVGGLIDFAALGSGDHHMALGLLGMIDMSIPKEKLSKGYLDELYLWQDRAQKGIKRDIGFVPGMLAHYWHGKKAQRKYWDRWKIITENQFDPRIDLRMDSQGVLALNVHDERQRRFRDQTRAYFRERNEDSIDMV